MPSTKTFVQIPPGDPRNIGRTILFPHAMRIYEIIKKFKEDNKTILPSNACKCLSRFITDYAQFFSSSPQTDIKGIIPSQLCIFESLQAEVTYYLSDFSAVAKRLSERAFLHLQRSIIADPSVKQRWHDAFKKGEVACEKLGSVHLLLHGIWAFKVNASGERTDLVFQEPISNIIEVEQTAEALVLTEWKVVKSTAEQKKKAKQAYNQAALYAMGVLAGIELRQYRYLVLVSEDRLLETPEDIKEGDIVYRYINIAVDPKSPSRPKSSQAARTKSR